MTRGGAAAARVAHNHEVAGSSPAPATKEKGSPKVVLFLWFMALVWVLRLGGVADNSRRFARELHAQKLASSMK